eukprot:TRINITY_DN18005_c0_g1_i1.p1 TRINITY_DN18005_c0_g1~~TRINITY_DN18005_c0_g1_i1.p1  ORF type:complete len:158 (-),score=22.68 TRINITY_DN18005_c0_g1_i1:77-550(-)
MHIPWPIVASLLVTVSLALRPEADASSVNETNVDTKAVANETNVFLIYGNESQQIRPRVAQLLNHVNAQTVDFMPFIWAVWAAGVIYTARSMNKEIRDRDGNPKVGCKSICVCLCCWCWCAGCVTLCLFPIDEEEKVGDAVHVPKTSQEAPAAPATQ